MDYREEIRAMRKTNGHMLSLTPEFGKILGDFHQKAAEGRALSNKHKELISLGIAISIRCDACILGHVESALRHGATIEEIVEVGEVALSMAGGPAMLYAAKAVECAEQLMKK